MKRLATSLLLLLLAYANPSVADVADASVCDILANPAAFDGKMVRIKAATVSSGFDEFLIEGADCKPASAIWLSYPANSKGKAGPAAFVRLQLARNSAAVSEAPRKEAVTLQNDDNFRKFDSLLATPYKSPAQCLGCARYTVTATLVGRLDGVSAAGLSRDGSGKVTGLAGFGNLNLYPARLVLQSVSEVVPHEVQPVKGDSRRAPRPDAGQLRRAIAAYGAEGEDNGVVVSFGTKNEVPPDDGAKSTRNSPDGVVFYVSFDMDRIGKAMLQQAMAHVGTHIADVRGGASLPGVGELEARAWQTTFVP